MKPDRKSIYEAIMRDVREEFLGTSRVNEDLLDDMSVERSMDAAQRIVTRESLQQLAGDAVAQILDRKKPDFNPQGFTAIWKPADPEALRNVCYAARQVYGERVNLNWIDVSEIDDMSYLFHHSDFNGNISKWDVSNVRYMNSMFYMAHSFNRDISRWDVRRVVEMKHMFGESVFNGNISGWKLNNARFIGGMFMGSSFNRDISGWDVSNVEDMSYMFCNTTDFNQDISHWNVSSVTLMDEMFSNAKSFSQNLSGWDVSSVKSSYHMFTGCPGMKDKKKRPAGLKYTGYVNEDFLDNIERTPEQTAAGRVAFRAAIDGAVDDLLNDRQPQVDLEDYVSVYKAADWNELRALTWNARAVYGERCSLNWIDTSGITDMHDMFLRSGFNGDISKWDVSGVENFKQMFYGSQFNSDISGWDVRNGRDFSMMFAVSDFNQDISSWNPENAEDMYAMFQGSKFCQDISSWRLPRRCKTTQMMYTVSNFPDKFAPRLKNKINEDFLDSIDRVKSSRGSIAQQLAFEGAIQSAVEDVLAGKKPSLDLQALTSVYKPKPDKFGNDIEFHNLIHNSIKIWGDECSLNWIDTSGITDFTCLFEWGKFNGDISKWDTSSARKMTMMFRNNKKFNGDISSWDVSNVEDMQGMFMYASSFNQDISGWDVRNLKYMDMMFRKTSSFDQDLSGWQLNSLDESQKFLKNFINDMWQGSLCAPCHRPLALRGSDASDNPTARRRLCAAVKQNQETGV